MATYVSINGGHGWLPNQEEEGRGTTLRRGLPLYRNAGGIHRAYLLNIDPPVGLGYHV